MIKLEVEIKDEKFIYSYWIGESNFNSSAGIGPDFLCAFTALLEHLRQVSSRDRNYYWDAINAKAWIESHTEDAKDFIKGLK